MKCFRGLFVILVFGSTSLRSQNKEILYDFLEIPQSLLENPGRNVSYEWYAGIPFLSGVYANGATSGITVNDIFAADGIDINQKVREKALNALTNKDEVNGIFQVDLINGGFRGRRDPKMFYSFGVYSEGYVQNYWPKDLALLAFEGNADQLGRRFDLGDLNAHGQLLNVFHFGINRQMNKNLTLGGRVKLYSAILDFRSNRNSGYFETNVGQNNLLVNTLSANLELRSSGFNELFNAEDDGSSTLGLIAKRGLFSGNIGLGLDLGFSYKLNEQMTITGSLIDLGMVYYTSDIVNYSLKGSASIEGVEVILPEALLDPDADLWEDLVDEIEESLPFEENDNNYTSIRPVKLYGSFRYDFGKKTESRGYCDCDYSSTSSGGNSVYVNSAGIQVFAINRPRGPQAAITAFYQRRFGKVLSVKTTYTVNKFTASNLGIGLSLQAGPVNIYLLGSNILSYSNIADSNFAAFQLGLNILSWNLK